MGKLYRAEFFSKNPMGEEYIINEIKKRFGKYTY